MRRDEDPARLTDDPGLDPFIGDLLRSTEPYRTPPGRKQRVFLSLGSSGSRRAPVLLRSAIVVAVLVGFGAIASAALGPWRGWIGRAYERLVPSGPSAAGERPRVHRSISPPVVALAPSAHAAPAPAAAPAAPLVPITPLAIRPAPAPRVHHVPAPPAGETETQAVLEAMRALRLDKNPVRARELLAKYLERNPSGALAEEALALTIEAAVAHHDADAAALGARYLRRYPAGPFRALAAEAQR